MLDGPRSPGSLWELTATAGHLSERFIADDARQVGLHHLAGATTLAIPAGQCRGRSVLLHCRSQLSAALAMLELDGIAARLVLAPPDLAPAQLPIVMEKAGADLILSDNIAALAAHAGVTPVHACGLPPAPGEPVRRDHATEWLLFTSGTTGIPKMAVHSLLSLVGPMQNVASSHSIPVWSTFYDIRRYGGLQILLRALTGGGSMLLSAADEEISAFLTRIGKAGVQRISGTPSHWRRALMSGAIGRIAPEYVRLSGEIADQNILNTLGQTFPAAVLSHAFASTEAGVAFDVRDGLAGFPAAWIGQTIDGVEMRIGNGSLQIRSPRTAAGYAGEPARPLKDEAGFVDTGDMLDLQGERYCFAGRREGVINVGGQKVHPEEVEAVINQHPAIRMSRVKARANPVTGAIVVADIVLEDLPGGASRSLPLVTEEVLKSCRDLLPPHKVPVILKAVPSLEITAAGKLLRSRA